ncbi:hypothetical protein H920_03416 [Fukomys damarensis]|uniref:Uncharacterized protein n=1 Tax=Fukomys damarensis TaxID=885580 RepID=A0A091EII5_FUKDA|nr:hypothetical protein H920_03416 [Fukomys damarensis]
MQVSCEGSFVAILSTLILFCEKENHLEVENRDKVSGERLLKLIKSKTESCIQSNGYMNQFLYPSKPPSSAQLFKPNTDAFLMSTRPLTLRVECIGTSYQLKLIQPIRCEEAQAPQLTTSAKAAAHIQCHFLEDECNSNESGSHPPLGLLKRLSGRSKHKVPSYLTPCAAETVDTFQPETQLLLCFMITNSKDP